VGFAHAQYAAAQQSFEARSQANHESARGVHRFNGSDVFAPPRKTWLPAEERVDNRPLG
jgi:hypothetical protein